MNLKQTAFWLSLVLGMTAHAQTRLGASVNSDAAELAPRLSPDGQTLYFARVKHPENIGGKDIWRARRTPDGWRQAERLPAPLNTPGDNSVLGVSADGRTLLLSTNYLPDGKGFSMSREVATNVWSAPEPVRFAAYDNEGKFASAWLCSDGRTMLLDLQGKETQGLQDLYVSFLEEDGVWTAPQNLGPDVNTSEYEFSPALAPDLRTLYFASSGWGGYGSADIFVTRRLDDTWRRWSAPLNLGPAVNGSGLDAYFAVDAAGTTAWFSSAKAGAADIYEWALPDSLRPTPSVVVEGTVVEEGTKRPLAATVRYEDLRTGLAAGRAAADNATGHFRIVLPAGAEYALFAERAGYYAVHRRIKSADAPSPQIITLAPLEAGRTFVLGNVFFETGKAELLPESRAELLRVRDMMLKQSTMRIVINGHTDNVGAPQKNKTLSQARAEAVRAFLIMEGAPQERLTAVGYGAERPVAPNATAEGRAQNRRVEFQIPAE